MCPTGSVGALEQPGSPARPGQTGGNEVPDALHRTEGRTVGARRGGDGEHQIGVASYRGHQTGRVAGQEGAEEVAHDPGEVSACLIDRRLLVPPQHGVQRPARLAVPEREHRGQRGSEPACHVGAGEADGPCPNRRTTTDPANPRTRSGNREGPGWRSGMQRRVRVDVRERSARRPVACWPGCREHQVGCRISGR